MPNGQDSSKSGARGDDRDSGTAAPPGAGRRFAGDLGGAFGDLGTFVPHTLGAITVAGLAPAGVLILVVLGATGAIARFARLIPQSVVSGLQRGLGITLAPLSLESMAEVPWLGLLCSNHAAPTTRSKGSVSIAAREVDCATADRTIRWFSACRSQVQGRSGSSV